MPKILFQKQLFTAADKDTADLSYECEMPGVGGTVLLMHKITDGSTGGFCTLYQSPDGTTKIAHQGGDDVEGVKTSNTASGSYCAMYKNVGKYFIVDLAVNATNGGTHDVWVTVLDN